MSHAFVLTAFDAPLTIDHAIVRAASYCFHSFGELRHVVGNSKGLPKKRQAELDAHVAATVARAKANIAANVAAEEQTRAKMPVQAPAKMAKDGVFQVVVLGQQVEIGDVWVFDDMRITSARYFEQPIVLNYAIIDALVNDVKKAKRMPDNPKNLSTHQDAARAARAALPDPEALRDALLAHVGKVCFIAKH